MSKKKVTKKRLKQFDKEIEELFWNLGTLIVRGYEELSYMLGGEFDYEDTRYCVKELEKQHKLAVMAKGLDLWIDYIPF